MTNEISKDLILDDLKRTAKNLINLRVVTIIGDAKVSGSLDNLTVSLQEATVDSTATVIATNTNLIESDITSVIPKKFEDNFDSPILKYHENQVQLAQLAMEKRLELIQSLIKDIVPLFD